MLDSLNLPSAYFFHLFLIFCRLGGAIMTFPGLSDVAISPRIRLHIAVFGAVVMYPMLAPSLPSFPASSAALLHMVVVELIMGVMLMIGARIFMAALQLAGEIIGFTAGLQTANLFDPSSGANTSAPGLFLSLTAITLIFVTNLHHIVFTAVFQSYQFFPAGELPNVQESAFAVVTTVADMFVLGTKIAAPVMAAGFLVYAAFGVFNRLIPQLQVFFVAIPVNIWVGMLMLSLVLGLMMNIFMAALFDHAVIFTLQ